MGRFEPGGVSGDAISSAEQPTDASSATFSSSIGIFGLPMKALPCVYFVSLEKNARDVTNQTYHKPALPQPALLFWKSARIYGLLL